MRDPILIQMDGPCPPDAILQDRSGHGFRAYTGHPALRGVQNDLSRSNPGFVIILIIVRRISGSGGHHSGS